LDQAGEESTGKNATEPKYLTGDRTSSATSRKSWAEVTLKTAALLTRTNEPDAGETETGETIKINERTAEKELNANPCSDRKDEDLTMESTAWRAEQEKSTRASTGRGLHDQDLDTKDEGRPNRGGAADKATPLSGGQKSKQWTRDLGAGTPHAARKEPTNKQ
jgi:hypothetical protein